MHQFIVSDLDGTMLDKNSTKLSDAMVKEIEKQVSENRIFCVASGRSYVQLKKLFEPLKTVPIYFICCDGALCMYKEQTVFSFPLQTAFDESEKAIAYGKYTVFANEKIVPFYRDVLSAYNGHVLPLSDIKEQEIFKVALKDAPLKEKGGCVRTLAKGGWQEYVTKGVDKGMAVKKLQQLLEITKEQTVILGDAEGKDFVSTLQNNL